MPGHRKRVSCNLTQLLWTAREHEPDLCAPQLGRVRTPLPCSRQTLQQSGRPLRGPPKELKRADGQAPAISDESDSIA